MLRLIRIAIVIAILWSGYWLAAGWGLRSSLSAWFDARTADGWQAEFTDIATGGFPFRHRTVLENPVLANPATGTAWRADWLSFDSPAVWPGHQTVRVADTPQRWSYFDQTSTVTMAAARAELRLHPGLALELQEMTLLSGPWRIDGPDGTTMQAQSLSGTVMQQPQARDTYRFAITAEAFSPGEGLRRVVQRAASLPRDFSVAQIDMTVAFDRPWDRSALEQRRPQPRDIDLRLVEMEWGALHLFATGKVQVDAGGLPEGEITVKAENWQDMLAVAQAAGAIPAEAVGPVTQVFRLLSGVGGNPNALDATITLEDGKMWLGPLPLGPAPLIRLR